MDSNEKQERKREAWRRLQTQRQRVARLRGRVVAISLVCFALMWGVVFAQMATGNDPALSARSKAVATTGQRAKTKAKQRSRRGSEAVEIEPGQVAIETTESRELESQAAEIEAAEAEVAEAEGEVESEPEVAEPEVEEVAEPEPVTTSQS